MQNVTGQYLLAAFAADAAFVACDNGHDYGVLARCGQTANSAGRLSELCGQAEEGGECDAAMRRKIRGFLKRNRYGMDVWFRTALESALAGEKIVLDEFGSQSKASFDREYRKVYGTEPPTLE